MKNLLLVVLIAAGAYWYFGEPPQLTAPSTESTTQTERGREPSNGTVEQAFANRQSGVQVLGRGVVRNTLPDDSRGSRHQRFILRLPSGQTLLVAHNIDLARRIDSLDEGDTVEFYGEYEWNDKGGLIHWTHHDPNGRHVAGWLKHEGAIYH